MAQSPYVWRLWVMSPAAALPWLRGTLAALWPCPPGNVTTAFGTPLSPAADPTADPVYFCGSVPCKESQRQALGAAEGAGQIPAGVVYCRIDAATQVVMSTNYPPAADRVGRVWDTEVALTLVGLAWHRAAGGLP